MTIDKVKLRDKKNTIYLPSTSYKDFYRNNFTIVYPNGGTKENPANITLSSRYIVENPFPGYYIHCEAEIFYSNKWFTSVWEAHYEAGRGYGHGLICKQYNDDSIVLKTGDNYLSYYSSGSWAGNVYPSLQDFNAGIQTAPARIKVWKVGIIDE